MSSSLKRLMVKPSSSHSSSMGGTGIPKQVGTSVGGGNSSAYGKQQPKSRNQIEVSKAEFDEYMKLKREQNWKKDNSQLPLRAQTAKSTGPPPLPSGGAGAGATSTTIGHASSNSDSQVPKRNIQSAVNLRANNNSNGNAQLQQPMQGLKYFQLPGLSLGSARGKMSNQQQSSTQIGMDSSTGSAVSPLCFQPQTGEPGEPNAYLGQGKLPRTKSATTNKLHHYSLKQFSTMKQANTRTAAPLVIHLEPEDECYDDLRDKLWDQVYFLKNQINELSQSNTNARSKAWNIEKENRKMIKQIEAWNLAKGVIFDEENKPFVDSATSERVFVDSNFQAISLKKEITQLQVEIGEYDAEIKDLRGKIAQSQEDASAMKDSLNEALKDTLLAHSTYQSELHPKKHQAHLQDLEAEKYNLSQSIKTVSEKNRVIRFMIGVQQGTFDRMQEELKVLRGNLDRKHEEEDELQAELKERIPRGELEELHQKNLKKNQHRVTSIVLAKSVEEQLEEKEILLAEQQHDIEKVNYNIQEITRNSILEKQDLIKDVTEYKSMISGLEQKYLVLQARHRKRLIRSSIALGVAGMRPNQSEGIIQYGSSTGFAPSIQQIPDHIVKENNKPRANPLDLLN